MSTIATDLESTVGILRSKIKEIENKQPHECPYCSYKDFSYHNIQVHIEFEHGEKDEIEETEHYNRNTRDEIDY